MRKIKTAVIGTGFMGRVHVEQIRRLSNVELVAVAAETEDLAAAFRRQMGIERTTADYRTLLADPEIQAVHVCTPTATHYQISKDAMLAGKHVLCEKPLAVSSAEALELVGIAQEKNLANCLNHNLRCYPVVQQIRRMRETGALGEVLAVQGTYSQDFLLYDTDWKWMVLAKNGGPLCTMANVGSHWMDMIQHVTGLKITSLCADLQTFHKTRKRPKGGVASVPGKTLRPEDYDEIPIDTEDFGAVLLRLGDRARGAFTTSQVAAGCRNRLQIEVYGTKAGVIWNQERPDELWIGHRNTSNEILLKTPALLEEEARSYADLPGGHSEGYESAHKQNFRRFYATVEDRSAPVQYATFKDGYQMARVLEKVLESARTRSWVDIEPLGAEASA
jgi:predicted dehydrogenase